MERRSQVGTGRFGKDTHLQLPQDRVTDHRIGMTAWIASNHGRNEDLIERLPPRQAKKTDEAYQRVGSQ